MILFILIYFYLMFGYKELYSSSRKLNIEFMKKQFNCRITTVCFIEREEREKSFKIEESGELLKSGKQERMFFQATILWNFINKSP